MEMGATMRWCAVFGLLTAAAAIGAGDARADWATFQANAAHTGYVRGRYNFQRAKLLWTTPVSADAPNGLAVGDKTVFVTNLSRFSDTPSFHALDQATGSVLWSKSFGAGNDTTSPPAYATGVVYFQTDGHTYGAGNFLNAYDARTGTAIFNAPYDAQWETYLNPTPFGNSVYVGGGYYGGMYAFTASSGSRSWFGTVPQYDGWTPAVDGTYAYAYTGSGDTTPIQGVFTVLNLADGTTAAAVVDPVFTWNGYTMNSAVVLGLDHDAITINGGRLVSWDTTLDAGHTPHVRWSLDGGFSDQPALGKGKLYVIANGGLSVLDEATGSVLWTWMPPSGALTGAVIATDNLVFATTATETFAIRRGRPKPVWSAPVSGTLAFSDRRLYVAGSDGAVYAFGR